MSFNQCERRSVCPIAAIIVSIIIGAVTAILQGTGVITVLPIFLYGALVTALVYLGVLLITAAILRGSGECAFGGILALVGILGTIILSGLLLGVTTGTGVLGAILVGALLFFVSLMLSALACFVKCALGE